MLALAAAPTRAEVWTLGHGDIGVAYDPLTPSVFEMEVHVEQGGVVDGTPIPNAAGQAFEPGGITIRVPSTANLQRINNPHGLLDRPAK